MAPFLGVLLHRSFRGEGPSVGHAVETATAGGSDRVGETVADRAPGEGEPSARRRGGDVVVRLAEGVGVDLVDREGAADAGELRDLPGGGLLGEHP